MRVVVLLSAIVAAFSVSPAAAEAAPGTGQGEPVPVTQDGSSFHYDALGHRFTVPVPDWLSGAERLSPDILAHIETGTYADASQAFVEFFPEGQSVEQWRTTYAARITLSPDRTLRDYRSAAIYGMAQACQPEATGFFLFGEETDDFFPALAFVCGAYRDDIEQLRGQGEVMVAVFRKTDKGVGMVYQEWKGPAFDPSDPATWPVDAQALERRAHELQANAVLALRAD